MSDADIPIEDKIKALNGALRWREEVLALRAENKRLRALLDEVEGVEAENDRLREELTETKTALKLVMDEMQGIARAALLAKEAGE